MWASVAAERRAPSPQLILRPSRSRARRCYAGEDLLVGAREGELEESSMGEPPAVKRRAATWYQTKLLFETCRGGARRSSARVYEFGLVGFERDAVAGDGVLEDAERFGGGDAEVATWKRWRLAGAFH